MGKIKTPADQMVTLEVVASHYLHMGQQLSKQKEL
jgi:hypothetical protein